MKPHGAKALNSYTGMRSNPHLNKRGACDCDCRRCEGPDDMCVCPDCVGGDVCGIHAASPSTTEGNQNR